MISNRSMYVMYFRTEVRVAHTEIVISLLYYEPLRKRRIKPDDEK